MRRSLSATRAQGNSSSVATGRPGKKGYAAFGRNVSGAFRAYSELHDASGKEISSALPSGRWRRPVLVLVVGYLALGLTAWVFILVAVRGHDVPIDAAGNLASSPGTALEALRIATIAPALVAWLAWIIFQVPSFRRADGERRQQLKWLYSRGVPSSWSRCSSLLLSSRSHWASSRLQRRRPRSTISGASRWAHPRPLFRRSALVDLPHLRRGRSASGRGSERCRHCGTYLRGRSGRPGRGSQAAARSGRAMTPAWR